MHLKATVFIPTLNGGDLFRETLAAVRSQEADFEFEIVVIDSGSRDGSDSAAVEAGARLIRIDPATFNHGRTRNQGISAARGEFVAMLSQDACPADRHWLARLVASLEAEPDGIGAYCRQIPRPDCDPFVRDRLGRWAATRTERVVQAIPDPAAYQELAPLDRLAAAAFDNVASCVRRSMMAEFPFPERRFGEDVAWAREVLLAGRKIVFEPAAAVVHSHNESILGSFRRVYMDHQNLQELFAISLIPGPRALLHNCWAGIGFYNRIITNADDLGRVARWGWRLYCVPYCWSQALAQYLGPRSNRWRASRAWFRRVDCWIVRRG